MGVSVIRGIKVGAFQADDGTIYYMSYTEGWGKKYGPKEAEWNYSGFGDLKAFMSYVLSQCAAAYSGDLQGAGGRISPLTLLNRYLHAMAQPFEVNAQHLSAAIGTGFGKIEPKFRDRISEVMGRYGLTVTEDTVRIELRKHPQALAEILALKDVSWPWSVGLGAFTWHQGSSLFGCDVYEPGAYRHARQSVQWNRPVVLRTDWPTTRYWVRELHGPVSALYGYELLHHLLQNDALEAELVVPGAAESIMKEAIKAIADGFIEMPEDQLLKVYHPLVGAASLCWYQQAMVRLGLPVSTPHFNMSLKDMKEKGIFQEVMYMANEHGHVRFHRPQALAA